MMLRFLISLLVMNCGLLFGAPSELKSQETTPVKSHVHDEMVILTVDKARLKAELKTWPEDPSHSKNLVSLRIAIGKMEGDKQVSGDNKTPEGIYFAQRVIDDEELPAKYGPKAIPIDFPNPMDKMDKKTGNGIWLHGVESDTRINEAKVTEGCVAFYNEDILALTQWLVPHQAIVMIAQDSDKLNQPADIESLKQSTNEWLQSWQDRRLDMYIEHYGDDFRFRGMDVKKYRDYKAAVFSSYKNMDVKMSNIRVFTHEKYGLSIMNQDFNGDDRYVSEGRKVLYWQRDASQKWRIVNETFENKRLEFVRVSSDDMMQFTSNSPSTKFFTEVTPDATNL